MFQNGFHGLEVANVIKLLQKEGRRIKRGPQNKLADIRMEEMLESIAKK